MRSRWKLKKEYESTIFMDRKTLVETIRNKRSFLCVGLDSDITNIPAHLQKVPNAIFQFNKQIIDATKDCCVAYKINTAFYEATGIKGWEAMEQTLNYIPSSHFKIADAKRGDIGNTSSQYAKAFFETLKFDAITIAPYMGEDSIRPFLEYENKWAIVLGLTSNKGALDFEMQRLAIESTNHGSLNKSKFLYEKVLETVSKWGSIENLMFVAGATQSSELVNIRKIIPDHFLLVPGLGFQGGNLQEVAEFGMTKDCGLLINASRAIIYAGKGENFAADSKEIASQYQTEMSVLLRQYAQMK